ncbi:hypothetical protein AJ79_01192 [Helicocarpus griseus UAMH5409]|uniref:Serine/threonine-protein kinase ppk6 n=1 Tax=Helicocarpus griseus UAMH5409 TaxID=1447875 RepID=A0A2B7Y8Q7_9EURO|nr:hypothetical protein AJ79_01192 [Helicocarpus griseus UAMH5409]
MSADLFAAFGQPNTAAQSAQSSQSRRQNGGARSLIDTEDADTGAWGSFLSGSQETRIAGQNNWQQPFQSQTRVSNARPAQVPFADSNTSIWREEGGADVLFDASTEDIANEEDTDDWGEFETAKASSPNKKSSNAELLIWDTSDATTNMPSSGIGSTTAKFQQHTLDDLFPHESELRDQGTVNATASDIKFRDSDWTRFEDKAPGNPTSANLDISDPNPWDDDWTKFEGSVSNTPAPSKLESSDDVSWATDWTNFEESVPDKPARTKLESPDDDGWGDFTDVVQPGATTKSVPLQPSKPQTSPSLKAKRAEAKPSPVTSPAVQTPTRTTSSSGFQVRPMNIPPPSILLPLFPPLIEQYHQRAVTTKQPQSQDTNLASSLERDLKVMVRILAGRTHRWKRDTVLSQSTRIGPARSGKAGGMKLSSLNKSENVKEEQEAVEVLEAWRKRSSYLNSVLVSASRNPIPVLTGNIQVKTGTAEGGGVLKAPHACGLCGLKRDERIPKVDVIVHDNFGEWWIDHWGHTGCRDFWEANCGRLNQR